MTEPIDLIKGAWARFREHAMLYMGIYAVPAVLTVIYALVQMAYMADGPYSMGMADVFILLFAIALMVVNILAGIAMIKAVDNPIGMTVSGAYKASTPHFWQYLWVSILSGVAIFIGFILLIIPGIILMVWFAFALFVLILEGKKGTDALKASREYVRGKWWGVFGRLIVLIITLIVIAIGAHIIFTIVTMGASEIAEALSTIVNIVLVPFSIAYIYLLYKDLRGGATQAEEMPRPSTTENAEEGMQ